MTNLLLFSFFSMLAAFFLSIRIYPIIIYLSHKKNLMDEPEERSAHTKKTPTLGGVGLFITFSLTIILFGIFIGLSYDELNILLAILGATILLLFLGLKDDLMVLSPKKKFMGQIVSASIIVLFADIRIRSMYGIFGIETLPYYISVGLTILVFIFIINAFNLIDGIDGLAGTIASLCSLTFGVFFLLNGNYLMSLVSCILMGSLVGFLRYNFSSKRKLFMGDTGSMLVGLLLSFQGICFLTINEMPSTAFSLKNAPIMVLAILAYPILDTFRVFIIRIAKKQNPFTADRNHIHHRLLNLGLNHRQATVLISFVNILIIGFTFILGDLYINLQLYIVLVAVTLIGILPFFMIFEKKGDSEEDIAERELALSIHNELLNEAMAPSVNFDPETFPQISNGSYQDPLETNGVNPIDLNTKRNKKRKSRNLDVVFRQKPY